MVVRAISVTSEFSDILYRATESQRAALDSFTPLAAQREMDAAYQRWSTAAAIVSAARIIERAGQQFRSWEIPGQDISPTGCARSAAHCAPGAATVCPSSGHRHVPR